MPIRSSLAALVAASALYTASPAAAQDDPMTASTVVATVNGVEITLGHILMVRAGLAEQYQSLPDAVLWEGLLDQVIRQEALAQEPEAEETTRVRVGVDNERRALLASEALAAVSATLVSEEDLRAAYAERYETGAAEPEFNASHILVESEADATAIIEDLDNGADFAELARERSTGPSGPNGGSLGWFGPGMMVAPFQEAVEALQTGEVSAPVQTQFGWHVILLNDLRDQDPPSFEAVAQELRVELEREAITGYVDEVVGEAEVTRTPATDIDPSVLSDMRILED